MKVSDPKPISASSNAPSIRGLRERFCSAYLLIENEPDPKFAFSFYSAAGAGRLEHYCPAGAGGHPAIACQCKARFDDIGISRSAAADRAKFGGGVGTSGIGRSDRKSV